MRERRRYCVQAIPCGLAIFLVYLNVLATYVYRPAIGDFGSFLASARAFVAHRNPFGVYPLTLRFVFGSHQVVAPNLNPPITVYPLALVASLAPIPALRVWYGLTLVLYVSLVATLYITFPTTHRLLKV